MIINRLAAPVGQLALVEEFETDLSMPSGTDASRKSAAADLDGGPERLRVLGIHPASVLRAIREGLVVTAR
jgi:hypothetical protein